MSDVVIVGSGPNGLSCGIALLREGLSVTILEKSDQAGGALKTKEDLWPGCRLDLFSACHPLGAVSPFFKSLSLEENGLTWVHSPAAVAHPLENGQGVLLHRSISETARGLGEDGASYEKVFTPLVEREGTLFPEVLGPVVHWPRHPLSLARFGFSALRSARGFALKNFKSEKAQALFAGISAHSSARLERPLSAAPGLMLQFAAHVGGWPFPKGGAGELAKSLVSVFKKLGGDLQLGREVKTVKDLPHSEFVVFDLTPRQISKTLGRELPSSFRQKFEKFRYGPSIFKMDWVLKNPIPWAWPSCAQAMTVHLGGSLENLCRSERAPYEGRVSEKPFVLLCQPSLFDSSRAPDGLHTAWAYIHVPFGSREDYSNLIENQIEHYAPGFKQNILAKRSLNAENLEALNPNLVGGDISGGGVECGQLLFRPIRSLKPYNLGSSRFWICSSSTPPGPGAHGMCGFRAAQALLKEALPLD